MPGKNVETKLAEEKQDNSSKCSKVFLLAGQDVFK